MEAMVVTGVDTARGLLRLRLSLDTAMVATDTAVATMARGLLMPSLRLMLLLRLSPVMVMAVAMAVMAVMVGTDVATTARGLLMPSPRLMLLLRPSPVMVMAVAMAVMAVMVATDGRGYYGKREAEAEPGYGY